MTDISKCKGTGCIKRHECYRYTAPVSEHWQSWIIQPAELEKCEFFWGK